MDGSGNDFMLAAYYGPRAIIPAAYDRNHLIRLPRTFSYGNCLILLYPTQNDQYDLARKNDVKNTAQLTIAWCTSDTPEISTGGEAYEGLVNGIRIFVLPVPSSLQRTQPDGAQINDPRILPKFEDCMPEPGDNAIMSAMVAECLAYFGRTAAGGRTNNQALESGLTSTLDTEFPGEILCVDDQDCNYGFKCQEEAFIGTDTTFGLPASKLPTMAGHCVVPTVVKAGKTLIKRLQPNLGEPVAPIHCTSASGNPIQSHCLLAARMMEFDRNLDRMTVYQSQYAQDNTPPSDDDESTLVIPRVYSAYGCAISVTVVGGVLGLRELDRASKNVIKATARVISQTCTHSSSGFSGGLGGWQVAGEYQNLNISVFQLPYLQTSAAWGSQGGPRRRKGDPINSLRATNTLEYLRVTDPNNKEPLFNAAGIYPENMIADHGDVKRVCEGDRDCEEARRCIGRSFVDTMIYLGAERSVLPGVVGWCDYSG
ncbi:MAG: hypothetical protein M1827_007339 [Pycnora praestabilis]|nr:MAG: hypothetical protein M1827_007339 [Pycnora praestabilis]